MRALTLFMAVLLFTAMAFTGCTKDDPQPSGQNPTATLEGGETPPQRPPGKLP